MKKLWRIKNKGYLFYSISFLISAILLLTPHSQFLCSKSFAEQQRLLKIGVVGPETGEDSETGKMTLAGIELAARDFNNAGGINGKKIEIVHYDTQGNSAMTQAVVQKLLKDNVAAIIAAPTGWSTFGPVWLANAGKVIFMSAGSKRHIGRSGPFIFRNALPDDIATDETIKYAMEKLKFKNFALVTSMRDDETSLELGGLFRRAILKRDGRIIGETHVMLSDTLEDAVAELKKNVKEPIDAVIMAGDDDVAVDVIKELRKHGIKAPIIGGDILYTDDFLKKGGELVAGSILYSGFFPESKSPAVRKFIEDYKKMTGKSPGMYSAVAYDSFMLIANAIKQADSTEPAKLRESLANTKEMQGLTGRTSMDAHGEAIKQPFILRVGKTGGNIAFELIGD